MEMLKFKFSAIIRVDASKRFLDLLAGVLMIMRKNGKIIGNESLFTSLMVKTSKQRCEPPCSKNLYTDIIESGAQTAQTAQISPG